MPRQSPSKTGMLTERERGKEEGREGGEGRRNREGGRGSKERVEEVRVIHYLYNERI